MKQVETAVAKTSRELLLEQAASEAASNWAEACFSEFAKDGRPLEGGWPGTMPEARTRAGAQAGRALSKGAMPALSYEELGRIARLTYDEARRKWRAALTHP